MKYDPRVLSLPSVAIRNTEDGHRNSIRRNTGYGYAAPRSFNAAKNAAATERPVTADSVAHLQNECFMSTLQYRDSEHCTGDAFRASCRLLGHQDGPEVFCRIAGHSARITR